MRLSVVVILGHNALIHGQCLVKLAAAPEVIAAVKGRRPLLVIYFGQRHRAAAIFTRPKGLVSRDLNIPAAHFALDDRHFSPSFGFIWNPYQDDLRQTPYRALKLHFLFDPYRQQSCRFPAAYHEVIAWK
ncbi:MAG: hypothetical protein ACLR5X_04740 [Oscillospiraceae bacterium]